MMTIIFLFACDAYDVDDENGAGASHEFDSETRLAVFNELWQYLSDNYAGFAARGLDWEKVREDYASAVESADSVEEFYGVLSRLFRLIQDGHTNISFRSLCETPIGSRPQYFNLEDWYSATGICVTPMDSGRLLVYRAEDGNVAGLQPGDYILGYDSRAWAFLLKDLEMMDMPVCGMHASCASAERNLYLGSVMNNPHLFYTMEYIYRNSTEIMSVSTEKLINYGSGLVCSDQLPVDGVDFPYKYGEDSRSAGDVSWGTLEGTNIGYIYVYSWKDEAVVDFSVAVYELMETDGLIIDQRFNSGGMPENSLALSLLFRQDVDHAVTCAGRVSEKDLYSLDVSGGEKYGIDAFEYDSYDEPIAVLTGHKAASGGDLFPYLMRFHHKVRIFGRSTEGSFGAIKGLWDPDPYFGDITVSYAHCVMVDTDGNCLQGREQEPDVEVWLDPDDVAYGIDTVVETALEWIEYENSK